MDQKDIKCGKHILNSQELHYTRCMHCGCGQLIEQERLELDLKVCKTCAFSGIAQSKPMGRMIYSHKTAATIEIVPDYVYRDQKRYFTPDGSRSCVKNFSKNVCN